MGGGRGSPGLMSCTAPGSALALDATALSSILKVENKDNVNNFNTLRHFIPYESIVFAVEKPSREPSGERSVRCW